MLAQLPGFTSVFPAQTAINPLFGLPAKALSADDMALALLPGPADNPAGLQGARHWQSELNGIWLKQLLTASQLQQRALTPFGFTSDWALQWARPLIQATEQSVGQHENPDLVARDNQRIEGDYAAALKALVGYFSQPDPDAEDDRLCFASETCQWARETLAGQTWLATQLHSFALLEWQYHSLGQTHLAALKNLLRSLLQVLARQPFSNPQQQPFRKADRDGNWRETDQQYLHDCSRRLLELLQHDAFDVARFAAQSPCARLGACEWHSVPGSELYTARLRHYPRPDGVKANGKTLYMASPMINRCELFDLAPGKSVVEGMLALGYDLYMVDYGDPGPEQSELGLAFYAKTIHDQYLDLVLQRHPQQDIEVMAYCMGGTLFMPYLARRIEEANISGDDIRIRQVVLMTTPVLSDDEDSGHKPMRDLIRNDYDADIMALFYGHANVSPFAIGLGMNNIQPGVEQSAPEGFFSRAHVPGAIEDAAPFLKWLSSGTRFPARAHREWIQRVFMGNEIWRNEFRLPSRYPQLDNQPVNMDALNRADIALFDYCGLRDPIAPAGSCKTSERWGRLENNQRLVREGLNRHIEKNIGHIFVVSRKLLTEFLDTVADFLADEPPAYQGHHNGDPGADKHPNNTSARAGKQPAEKAGKSSN